ncbi:MAG TPA: ribosome biogenesis GTPase YlqF [Drouetiella sp.]
MPQKSGKPSGQSTAYKSLQDTIKWVDLVIEVLDARAPLASRHPNAQKIFGHKPRLVVLSKEDLADPSKLADCSALLKSQFEDAEYPLDSLVLSLKTQKNRNKVLDIALRLTEGKREQLAKRGLLPRPMRAVVVGMPNVGKSSLINWIIGKNKAKAANKPGVTRGPQWVRVHPQIELLDTPGFLPPASFSDDVRLKLSLLNLIPETTYDAEEVARHGLSLLSKTYPTLTKAYIPGCQADLISLEEFAQLRHFLTHGGKLDTSRAASTFLADLRNGKFGRVTLDRVSLPL